MRHGYFGRKLSRTSNERKRLLVVLARDLFKHGSMKTTMAKAKAVQPMVEKLITRTKKIGVKGNRRSPVLADYTLDNQLHEWVSSRFANRTSGYTRIVRLGERIGDRSELVLLSFVDSVPEIVVAKSTELKQEKKEVKKQVAPVNETKKSKQKKVRLTKKTNKKKQSK